MRLLEEPGEVPLSHTFNGSITLHINRLFYRFFTLCIGCFGTRGYFFLPPTVNVIHVHCGLQ